MSEEPLRYEPAVGKPASPAFGERGRDGIPLHERDWGDARWSYLYGQDTEYADREPADPERLAEASRRARGGERVPDVVEGPIIKPPVWTWEVPLYFWAGGIASGSAFVSFACDLAGDHASAATARKVALAALVPSPPLLIMDLGRPERFHHMMRIVKPRSPMSMGVWALTAFGNVAAAAVGADLLGRRRAAKRLGAANALIGGYLGSYTGVLLAATAVPLWARSRLFLGPIFMATATATGAATCRLTLSALGLPEGHPTRVALGRVQMGAMGAELALSQINERRLGPLAQNLDEGRHGVLFKAAKWAVRTGLGLQAVGSRGRGPGWLGHVASALYLGAGLTFRYAWVGAGKESARDDTQVAEMARSRRHGD
jgi:hypothetical protein